MVRVSTALVWSPLAASAGSISSVKLLRLSAKVLDRAMVTLTAVMLDASTWLLPEGVGPSITAGTLVLVVTCEVYVPLVDVSVKPSLAVRHLRPDETLVGADSQQVTVVPASATGPPDALPAMSVTLGVVRAV